MPPHVPTDLAALQAHVTALRWRNAEISRVITDALCAVDELTGPPFEELMAEIAVINAAPLPRDFAQPNAPAERTHD